MGSKRDNDNRTSYYFGKIVIVSAAATHLLDGKGVLKGLKKFLRSADLWRPLGYIDFCVAPVICSDMSDSLQPQGL